jgi:WD40 repeat protein
LEWGLDNGLTGAAEAAAQMAESPQPVQIPTQLGFTYFGDYELLGEIARGGMGVVYKARQVSLNRIVAVKIVLAGHFASKGARQRFKMEAEAAARLSHPNIVGIHEVGQHDGFHYFSMDYIEGKNLGQAVREQTITQRQAAEWVKTVAEAIHYAHEHDILHRDIKPSNILIDWVGVPHVTDFGLAKQVAGDSELTLSGEILGSPNYMPPEQAGGGHGKVGRTSDIYSLGAVLYHLLTGRPPFAGASLAETVHQVINQDITAPTLLNPGVPPDLETICLKCLEREPRRRYQNARELADELGRYLGDEPILARRIGTMERARRWCRRKPLIAGLATSLVLVFLLGVAGVVTEFWRLRGEIARLDVLNGGQLLQDGDYFKSLLWFAEALTIDQMIPAREEIHQKRFAAVLAQSPKLVQVISHDSQPLISATFSPLDDRLATIAQDRTARVWEIPSGRLLRKIGPLPAFPFDVSFSPEGNHLVLVLLDHTVRLYDSRTGVEVSAPLPHRIESAGGTAFLPVFDPLGRKLATQPKENELQIWDAATGKPLGARLVLKNRLERALFSPDGQWLLAQAQGIFAWNAVTGDPVAFPAIESNPLRAVSSTRRGNLALIGTGIWRFGEEKAEAQTSGSLTPIRFRVEPIAQLSAEPSIDAALLVDAVFSPAGDRLITTSRDRTARIWDSRTGQPLTELRPYDQLGSTTGFSPDGRSVLTASKDNTTRVWDADTGQLMAPPISHAYSPGVRVASGFSGTGRYLLTLHPSLVACVWDLYKKDSPPVLLRPGGGQLNETASRGSVRVAQEANNIFRVRDMSGGLGVPLLPSLLKTTPKDVWFDAQNRFVVLESGMAKVQVWDSASGTPVTPLVQSHYTVDEKAYKTVSLPPAGLGPKDAIALAELLSGSRLDGTGGWTNLTLEEMTGSWKRLSELYPRLFHDSSVDCVAWHRSEAKTAASALDWSTARFHYEKLHSLDPNNAEFSRQREYAKVSCEHADKAATNYWGFRHVTPPRDPSADQRMIELSAHYTEPLLDWCRPGLQTLGGISFDMQGAIRLYGVEPEAEGFRLPEQIPGIEIGRFCARIHFLHAAGWAEASRGAEVATVVVRYANSQFEKITMRNLIEVAADWSRSPSLLPEHAQVVWISTSPLLDANNSCARLFKYTWPNPHPDWQISTVDLVSSKGQSSYLLVAMTVE